MPNATLTDIPRGDAPAPMLAARLNKRSFGFLLWLVCSILHGQSSAPEVGRKALAYLLSERYTELTALFNDQMKAILTLEVLRSYKASATFR